MCNMSEGVERRALNRGIEQGRAEGKMEGRAEGRAEGIIETLANNIKAMIESGQFNFDSAFSLLKAPADKYSIIKEMVMG